ncbi:conserved hypothetical protein [Xenorhabdus nematophila F1]|uniref:Uncharacterized protein n=1 Tax=Xenorhabdus nematophila (strain ATCC 19061 / DSM 3370 / CCUG 14189 / LMG 1036 / NCIMB 9965 / AN6) TaxID=406817 RepID=D3VBW3_XENNA|nr:hypothetical protein XNC1_3924 [Xenorhabdus nematophila ATCC 19061]CCW31691.1 conserved hypothetical protein [Xenorhabdus nematophila F1]CEK24771.1 hypothetical protein XNC2_3780 [Xenorhabdus nematophila AN6/1]
MTSAISKLLVFNQDVYHALQAAVYEEYIHLQLRWIYSVVVMRKII